MARSALLAAALLLPTAAPAADMHHPQLFSLFQVDELEYRAGDGRDAVHWDAFAWIGGDDHKLWVKTEGERPVGEPLERAEVQVLYNRRISDFFDARAGVRYDFEPDPERGFLVLGLAGLAPYFIEVDGALFLSEKGDLSARLEAETDLPLTQRLILQPVAEINLAAGSDSARGVGSGLNDVELGLRLRYEVVREFAPYVGVNWERQFGETADLARADGEDASQVSLVIGVRFWF